MSGLLRRLWYFVFTPFRISNRIIDWIRGRGSGIGNFFTEEPEDSSVPDAFSKAMDRPSDILVHLDALRKHLLRAAVVLIIATALSFAFARPLMEVLAQPLPGGFESLRAIDVTESLGSFMRISLLAGFAISLPYIVLELWLFAAPGLSSRSRVIGLIAIPVVTLFFLAGMLFAYFVILPTALPFLVDFMGIQTDPRPSSYYPFVTSMMFWLGIIFLFPLAIFLLSSLGLVHARTLLRYSRLVIVLLAVVAAMITPTIDPVTMLLVWGPLVALYYLGIFFAMLAHRGRETEPEPGSQSQQVSN
ncbi:MAG: twin-arginine translocase subunit TatC [Anaerolineales bacterium]|nr:twin-arginine translocase subunit TatC [Anaerolineales bacterium]